VYFHGFELEIDGKRGDPSDPDPRFREDEIYIAGIQIVDEEGALHWFRERFAEEIEKEIKNERNY